nr:T9SS type A sorting domain-containing protein [Gammaproteobacteria bacterium]NIX58968.1 T9SS type A sorting domain-containing protein [candidate division Zixibacteria bacterium]
MAKAENLAEFESALQINPMSFNASYVGKNQNIKFWHIGKYQDRSDGVDPRLPHKGDGSEEWGGFIPFADLPMAANPAQDYFVNWNNKPVCWWDNGDNVPWISDYDRVIEIDNYVGPISSFTYQNLKHVPLAITAHGSYQQAIEMSTTAIVDSNIVPPGQSGFIDINGVRSPHFTDQWSLHISWDLKDQLFGDYPLPVSIEPGNEIVPERTALYQNYPNPFNPATTIRFGLPQTTKVRLEIYNLIGQRVAILVDEEMKAGFHEVKFDGRDMASGMYFYRLKAQDFIKTKKMLLMK